MADVKKPEVAQNPEVAKIINDACAGESRALLTASQAGKDAAALAVTTDYVDVVDCTTRIDNIKALYMPLLKTQTVKTMFSSMVEALVRDKPVVIKTELAKVSENGLGKITFTGEPEILKPGEVVVIDPKTEKLVEMSPADAAAKLSDQMIIKLAKSLRDSSGTANAAGQGRKPRQPVAERQPFYSELAGFLSGSETGPKILEIVGTHCKAHNGAFTQLVERVSPGNDDARRAMVNWLTKDGWTVSRKGAKANADAK
jgi:hypothetical protein